MNEFYRYAMAVGMRLWHQSLYKLHGKLHDTVTSQTRQGCLTMSTRDNGVAERLFSRRGYEYESSLRAVRFLKTQGFIADDSVCMLDIGANIGFISTGLLLANEVQNVVAVEPEPKNFALLVENMKQNRLSQRSRCLQVAIGNRETTLTMELSPCNLGDHRIRVTPTTDVAEQYNESSRRTVQVSSLTLKQLLERPETRELIPGKPSLIWIDVQGYAGYVFAGAKDILRKLKIPTVSEIWPYGIRRAGMSLGEFESIVSSIWSDYWVERRDRLIRYPISVFGRYLDELGDVNTLKM